MGSHHPHQLLVIITQKVLVHPYAQLLCEGHFQKRPKRTKRSTILIDVINSSAKAKQTTMPTVNQMNAARQQGAAARAQVDAELLTADPNLPALPPRPNQPYRHPKIPPPLADSSLRPLERMAKPLLPLGHLLLLKAA